MTVKVSQLTTSSPTPDPLLALQHAHTGAASEPLPNESSAEAPALRDVLHLVNLFTGQGVRTHQVRKGQGAAQGERLTLFQHRLKVDVELALRGAPKPAYQDDVPALLRMLAHDHTLLEQIIPAQRGVVGMSSLSFILPYLKGRKRLLWLTERAVNKDSFLLVRDGENVFVVYSTEPTQEATAHLFPIAEGDAVFDGLDVSSLPVEQLWLNDTNVHPEHERLHYARLLTLLCGVHSRHRLFGDLHAGKDHTRMLDHDFQREHFYFVADARPQLCTQEPSSAMELEEWAEECNRQVQTGSRILMSYGSQLSAVMPQLKRQVHVRPIAEHGVFSVNSKKGYHFIEIPMTNGQEIKDYRVWLNGPKASQGNSYPTFLCLDKVTLAALDHRLRCRATRTMNADLVRFFGWAERFLTAEHKASATGP